MTKLLSYTPKSTPEVGNAKKVSGYDDFSTSLYDDVWFSCTPDLPVLRYADTIPVFIWDELKTYKDMLYYAKVDPSMYRVEDWLVHSKDEFLPFKNTVDVATRGSKHDMILPSNPDWGKGFLKSPLNAAKRRMSGRILHMTLEGIQALDLYYFNAALHKRHKAAFVPTQQGRSEKFAWMYTVPTNNFTKYLPHEGTYEMLRGFEAQQCSSIDGGPYTSTYHK
jgi:hypothetical protein